MNNNAAIGGEAGFWAFAHVGEDTDERLRLKVLTMRRNTNYRNSETTSWSKWVPRMAKQ